MERVGERLRKLRLQRKLSLREVEARSLRYAQEWDNPSYQISASWLNRVEREEHALAVSKLIVLADIYHVSPEQILSSLHPWAIPSILLQQASAPLATALTEGPLQVLAKSLLPDTFGPDQLPDETTLLSAENVPLPAPYRWGIIGKHDRAASPRIPAGSVVQIDTRQRAISSRKNWRHEFQRPIYFLLTRDAFFCGWCELDSSAEWLTLIPHPLSSAHSRRWKYRKEIENLGRVVAVAIQLLPDSHSP